MKLIALLALVLAGCGQQQAPVRAAQVDAAPDASQDLLTNRVWVRREASDLPGRMLIFLDDGVLVMDSCWETYRLSKWRRNGDAIRWSEDSAEIQANVITLNENSLTLRLNLVSGSETEEFKSADAPYVCPDMPR